MKKLLPVIVFLMLMSGSCIRTFNSYVSDGNGGTYRVGQKIIYFVVGAVPIPGYVEHCKSENNEMVCRTVRVTAPGIVNLD